MDFSIRNDDVIISHNDEEVAFAFKYYLKGNVKMSEKIYGPINRYLKVLSDKDNKRMFTVYKRLHKIFYQDNHEVRYSEEHIQDVVLLLQDSIGNLYDIINYDHLSKWCFEKGKFYYQSNLKDDYGGYKPETTYLKEHYKGLLFLSTLLKFITPIWGVFITEFDKAIGKDYKETVALTLLNKTDILETEEFKKLEALVGSMSDKAINTINAIFGNLGTVDLPDWALATVTVRKVAVAEVDNEEVKLINIIFSHLTNLNKKNSLEDRGDSVRLKERKSPDEDSGGDDENRASVLEKLKLRQEHPDHVPIIDEVYIFNIKKMIKDIDKTVPVTREPYKSYIKSFNRLNFSRLDINEFHIKICSCVCRQSTEGRKIVSPRNLENLQYIPFLKLIFVTQVLLHHWGYNALANLLTAEREETANDVLKDSSFVTLPVEIQEELAQLYPYFKSNNKTTAVGRKPLIVNIGTMFVNDMVDYINKHTWFYTNDYLSDKKGCAGTMISVPLDMKIQLANLLIKTMNF